MSTAANAGLESVENANTKVLKSATGAPRKDNAISTLTQDFCENTTAHGFGSFAREEVTAGKTFWLVIILGAMVGSSVHLWSLVSSYLDYQTQEIVSVSHEPPPFPDVTVCNLNARSRSAWTRAENETFMIDYLATIAQIEKATAKAGDWENIEDRARAPVSFVENVGRDKASALGHQQHDFIVHCSFTNQPCHDEDFTHYVDGTFYNCYTFHHNQSLGGGPALIGSGPSNALSLILYLEAKTPGSQNDMAQLVYNWHSPVENSVGARVVIHERGSLALAVDKGFDVMPGDTTSFPVTATYLKRLGRPYDYCLTNVSLQGMEKHTYTSAGCLRLCKQKYILTQCGCLSAFLPESRDLGAEPPCDMPPCNASQWYCGTFNASDPQDYFKKITCESQRWYEFDSSADLRVGCKCHTPCKRYKYDVITTQSQWPGDEYVEEFFEHVVLPSGSKAGQQLGTFDKQDPGTFADLIRANFVRVNVYLHDLDVTSRVQQPSFCMSSLWSSVGGTLGLWAGISVVTLTECGALFLKIILTCCRKSEEGRM